MQGALLTEFFTNQTFSTIRFIVNIVYFVADDIVGLSHSAKQAL